MTKRTANKVPASWRGPSAPEEDPGLIARQITDDDLRSCRPVYAVWEITLKCDLACNHCGGSEGAKYDYGYRCAASYIDLGFDASESYHLYTIEWTPHEIRWFVDNRLVHSRVVWDPTPIPHLPMSFHINIWPTRSKELAGRLASHWFPARTFIQSIELNAYQHHTNSLYENTFS